MSQRDDRGVGRDRRGRDRHHGAHGRPSSGAIGAKLNSLLGVASSEDEDDADEDTPQPRLEAARSSARASARTGRAARSSRSATSSARSRSRHARPSPEDEHDPAAERPRRRRQAPPRDYDPADPPRRSRRGRGRRAIQTRAVSRSGKAVGIRAAAAIPTSARRRAAAASTATTGTNRQSRRSRSMRYPSYEPYESYEPASEPRRRRVRSRTGRTAPTRPTTRSRRSATADRARQTSTEVSSAGTPQPITGKRPVAGATARPNPGSTTSRSSRTEQRGLSEQRADLAGQREHQGLLRRRHRLHHVEAASRRAAPARLAPEPRGPTHRR